MSKANVSNGLGPISSSYVLNLLTNKKSEYAFEEEQQKPTAVPSQYAVPGLENIVTLSSNPNYQLEPLSAQSRHVVPGAGVPISAALLKQKVAGLEDKIYVPTILNGSLFFVSADDDARTAKESGSNTSTAVAPEEPSFTISQLTEFFGQEIVNKLATVKKGQGHLPEGIRQALVSLKKTSSSHSDGDLSTAASRSLEQLTTPHGSPWTTPTKGVNTAASRTVLTATDTLTDETAVSCTMLTGADTLTDRTAVSCTMLTGTDTLSSRTAASRTMLTGEEKSDDARTAKSDTSVITARSGSEADMAPAVDSTTGVPLYALLTTPTTDAHAASAVPSIDTMTALEAK